MVEYTQGELGKVKEMIATEEEEPAGEQDDAQEEEGDWME